MCVFYIRLRRLREALLLGGLEGQHQCSSIHPKAQVVSIIIHLTFQNPLNPGMSISVFLPKDYDRYAEDDRYPDLPIKELEHPTTKAGILQDLSSPSLNKCYIEMSRVCTSEEVDTPYLIKLGGFPILIQDKERYYRALERDGFTFMFQVDENGYPEGLVNENSPFNFGCFYAYALFKSDCFSELTAGFWQFS